MATKKDLVEAYSFSRRRLVTAFVSGAPGGREVEPARPGRTIVGGVALAVLLVAGAAIAGVFSPTAPTDWTQRGLIISKETGAAYVITSDADDPELHPVINATSASLILGSDAEPTLIEQDTIDDQRIGSDIGILGAPASVPSPSRLINTGWTGCTAADAGVQMTVTESPDVTPAPNAGLYVQVGKDKYAVISGDDGAHAYEMPGKKSTGGALKINLAGALNLSGKLPGKPIRVSQEWLDLFPVGAPLDYSSFELAGVGKPPENSEGTDLADYKVGQLLQTQDGTSYLVTKGGLLTLSPFAAAVYSNVADKEGGRVLPDQVDQAPAGSGSAPQNLADSDWPTEIPTAWSSADEPCAELATQEDAAPVVRLAVAGTDSSGAEVKAGKRDQSVDAGRGAYVLSGSFTTGEEGTPVLIDSKGRANPLVGAGAAGLLGYGDVPLVVVPDSWVKLFGRGVDLSQAAALSPPESPAGSEDSDR